MKKFYLMMALVLGALTANAKTVYLDANVWNTANANFEAWVWGGSVSGQWCVFTSEFGSIYKTEMPDDVTTMILLRKSPEQGTQNWDKWNRIDDIALNNTKDMCVITGWDSYTWGTFAYPQELYIVGHDNAWDPSSPGVLSKVDGEEATYVSKIQFVNATFKLSNKKGSWDEFNCGGINVGANIVLGEEVPFTSGACVDNKLNATGTFYVYVYLKDKTFLVTETPTAIESVEAASAAVEYYNLQGVKVANPEKGIFIKKAGNKTTKVIL